MHSARPDCLGGREAAHRTLFLTAVRVIGTSPHHMNPAITLGRTGAALRVVAPADTPGKFESDSILERELPDDAWRLVPRETNLRSRLGWYVRCWQAAHQASHEIDADQLFVYGSQVAVVALLLLPFLPRRTRVIYHTQDFLEPHRHPLRAWFEGLVCRRAAHVIVNERSRGRVLQSLYRLEKTPLTVPTGLLTDWPVPERSAICRDWLLTLSPAPPAPGDDPVLIVHQGPLRVNRCGVELLTALTSLPPRYQLVVTGMARTDLDRLTKGLAQSLTNRVILPGNMGFQDLLEVTASCDLGVLLYPNDGIGNFFQAPGRLSENGRAAIPSIASSFPPFQQIAAAHGFLALCDPDKPNDIAHAISALGSLSAADRATLGGKARDHALNALAFERNMAMALAEIAHDWA